MAALAIIAANASALEVPPRPPSGLADPGGVLPPEARRRIEAQLEGYAQGTTARYAVAIFPSLDSESVEDFSMRIAEAWKIGGKKNDNGVLLTIFMKEQKIRIDVGYGLEDKIPDAIARRIIAEDMAPHFRAGDVSGGILAALAHIDQLATGRAGAAPVMPHRRAEREPPGLLVLFLLVVVILVIVTSRRGGGRGPGGVGPFWLGGGGGWSSGGGGWGGGGGGWGGSSGG